MAYEQQIEKLRGHARAFVKDLEALIECYHLVDWAEKNSIPVFFENKRGLGFRIFRRSVGHYCFIGIARLAYDKGKKTPAAGILIAALTGPDADRLREELKARILKVAKAKQDFDAQISWLKDQWKWFSEHRTEFKDFRDKRLAHLEVSKIGDQYKPAEIQKITWALAVEAVKRLSAIGGVLSMILGIDVKDLTQVQ